MGADLAMSVIGPSSRAVVIGISAIVILGYVVRPVLLAPGSAPRQVKCLCSL